jgi:membrane-associated HD superfamily phosphohydrolase
MGQRSYLRFTIAFADLSAQIPTEVYLDGEALENVKELIAEEMEEGIEMLSDNVIATLANPLAEEFAGIVQADSVTMNDFFLRMSESKLENVQIDSIATEVAKSLGVAVGREKLEAGLNTVRASDAPALVASALATQFWKSSMQNVISAVSKDFARKAAKEVAEMAQEILEDRMKKEMTKLVEKRIEDIHSAPGPSKVKE